MIFMFVFQIIFLFGFLIKRLKSLKLFMLKFYSYNPKTTKSFPTPKNKKKFNKIIYNFIDDNKHNNKKLFSK